VKDLYDRYKYQGHLQVVHCMKLNLPSNIPSTRSNILIVPKIDSQKFYFGSYNNQLYSRYTYHDHLHVILHMNISTTTKQQQQHQQQASSSLRKSNRTNRKAPSSPATKNDSSNP
jgi:hypothetical protein